MNTNWPALATLFLLFVPATVISCIAAGSGDPFAIYDCISDAIGIESKCYDCICYVMEVFGVHCYTNENEINVIET